MRTISEYDKSIPNLVLLEEQRWNDPKFTLVLRVKFMFVAFIFLIVRAFIRLKITGYKGLLDGKATKKPILLALWHGSLLLPLLSYRKEKILIITSPSGDGDLLHKVFHFMGYYSVRGSSSRQGARALLNAIREVSEGMNSAIAVDGPKGPVFQVKPGIVAIAQKTGALIVPVGSAYSKHIAFKKAWDKTNLPLPFTKAVMHAGEPFEIKKDMSVEEGCELVRQRIEEAMKNAELNLQNYSKRVKVN